MEILPGDRILFMKVGIHAGETLEDILERKRREIEDVGHAMWGYGGSSCHPTRVRDFASRPGGPINLVMQEIASNHNAEQIRASEYSLDHQTWTEIPAGINVLGSKYALVISSLDDVDTVLDLSATRVGIGDRIGRVGKDYIRGRVDKACLEVVDAPADDAEAIKISLAAPLVDPYAVFLRA